MDSFDLAGVFAVPPLARSADAKRNIDFEQNSRIVRHITTGGITRLLYGGNAFLYHVSLDEFEQLAEWLSRLRDEMWVIPSIGPGYGHAIDQASILKRYKFTCVMILPSGDPRDAAGLERGYRNIAEASDSKLIVYLKDENNFGSDLEAGLDVIARLVDDGVCIAVKYAVVRKDPSHDYYLESLLTRIDRRHVISGIGERPAIIHMRDWGLPGFTTGSGCIAPALSQSLFAACRAKEFQEAERLRSLFIPLEDMRDQWGPAIVLHSATELSGIASTGPTPPYVTRLSDERRTELALVAKELNLRNGEAGI